MISYSPYNPISLTSDIDLVAAREARNDGRIRRWCRQYTLISFEDQRKWAEKIENDPTIKMFGVQKGSQTVGVCGFTSIDRHNRRAEFSLYVFPEYQFKGYGKLALQTLVRHGFFDWGFKRIWGEVFQGNPAMEMFKDVGFVEEGCLKSTYFRDGAWINSNIIAIIDDDYF